MTSPPDPASLDADASDDLSELEFRRLRAQNDLRLKSKFEAIFEKYGKDFTGIGDEIDLETGEIVVNNGHLTEMRDEQDVGQDAEQDMGRLLRALTEPPEQGHGSGGPIDAEDQEGEEMGDVDGWGEDDGLKDDDGVGLHYIKTQGTRKRKALALGHAGRELDWQYAILPRVTDDSQVETMWRAPGLLPPRPGTRPILHSALGSERMISTSPTQQGSLWAPPKRRGRPRAIPLDFFRDVLELPEVIKRKRPRRLASPVIISDGESGHGDPVATVAGSDGQSLSGHQIERDKAQLTPGNVDGDSNSRGPLRPINSEVICLVSPMKGGEARPYETPNSPRSNIGISVDASTELEAALESFRHQLAARRRDGRYHSLKEQPRGLTSNDATGTLTLDGEGRCLVMPPQEGGHPSLKQLARDLFFMDLEVFTLDEPPQSLCKDREAAENNYCVDEHHVGDHYMDGSGPGSLWESESESGSEWESKAEPGRSQTIKHRNMARAGGSGPGKGLQGGKLGSSKELREGRPDEASKKSLSVTSCQGGSPNQPGVLSDPPSLTSGKNFIVSLEDDGNRPPYPYYLLCGTAILSSPGQKLTSLQVRRWILEHFSYYRNTKGWERAAAACMKQKYGFAFSDKYLPPRRNSGTRKAYYFTILPEFVHLYLEGSKFFTRPWKKARMQVEPLLTAETPSPLRPLELGHSPGPPRTPNHQANQRPVPGSTPISNLLKDPATERRLAIQERDAAVRGIGGSESVTGGAQTSGAIQSNQDIQDVKVDILGFSDTESIAQGLESNQVVQGRNLGTAVVGSRSSQSMQGQETESQSSNSIHRLNAEAITEGLQPTEFKQMQNGDILEFSDTESVAEKPNKFIRGGSPEAATKGPHLFQTTGE
ncbi:hypothetical protein FGG08_006399 [Glutinoglossum americanum]|uniref:Fork-head domain-containing protein n=1 Tax=Glutinoglossum americanum TaxID=1670608 RepID=A0A9P8L0F3_9PEZI|nr:hypothetical protein FGG08_006399 [Glutinoglossum americanum]